MLIEKIKSWLHPVINPTAVFDLYTRDGRDQIADQIKIDLDNYCLQLFNDGPRTHLGISEIGHSCARYVWFKFRWMVREKFDGRMLRLFAEGHRQETELAKYLEGIGFAVKLVDVDGKQIRVAKTCGGHFGGSTDGGTHLPTRYGNWPDEILIEFKTANLSWFTKISNMGVVKGKYQHWIQACTYGKKLGIHYVLYICLGKNDSDIDIELLELDWDLAQEQERKAEFIILSQTPPPRLSNTPSYWECRMCPAKAICHHGELPERNCRSCQGASPTNDGQWHCSLWNQTIPKDFIEKGCDSWTPLPRL